MKVVNVCGARPNFMKVAPLVRAYRSRPGIEPVLVHTGQHYDAAMSRLFFDELGLPEPDVNLGVGSGPHGEQTARIMMEFERLCERDRPDLVMVVGDVNSTVACALVAAKLGIRVAHVEAGLRSFDRTMPEEMNRRLTDALADLLFVTERSGMENLAAEGLDHEGVHFVGNVMIDTLLEHRKRAEASDVLDRLGIEGGGYAVLTLHRPSNVDDRPTLEGLIGAFEEVSGALPLVFPAHPRTAARLGEHGLSERLAAAPGIRVIEPLGYLDFLKLVAHARVALTDSGGIQEETTVLGVPCVTIRDSTERPATCEVGSNVLAGTDPARVLEAFGTALEMEPGSTGTPPLWDGRAADRIADVIGAMAAGGGPWPRSARLGSRA